MQRPGYTLVELLVVIAIMAVVAVLAAPAAGHVIQSMTFRSQATLIAERLHALQVQAIQTQQVITVLRSSTGLKTAEGQSVYASNVLSARAPEAITFYPDGTTDGGRIILYDSSRELPIDIAWLTGTVTVGGP